MIDDNAPRCDYCGEPLTTGQLATEHGDYHAECAEAANERRRQNVRARLTDAAIGALLVLSMAVLFGLGFRFLLA